MSMTVEQRICMGRAEQDQMFPVKVLKTAVLMWVRIWHCQQNLAKVQEDKHEEELLHCSVNALQTAPPHCL